MSEFRPVPTSGNKSSDQIRKLVTAAFLLAIIIIMAVTPLGFLRLGITALTIIHLPVIIGSVLLGPAYGAFLGFAFGVSSVLNATFAPDLTSFAFSPFYSAGGFTGNGWSLVVAIVPRVLTGVVPFFIYKLLSFLLQKKYTDIIAHIVIILGSLGLAVYKLVEVVEKGTTSLLFDFLIYTIIFAYITGDAISKKFRFRSRETMPFAAAGVLGSLTNTVFVLGSMSLFFGPQVAQVVGTSADLLYKFIFTLIATNGIPEAIFASLMTVIICKAAIKMFRKEETA
ncbi:ECF transporter S component [Candidatus Nomurabacteria bacterium]|nr:ECF transporter S component [Candidatus Nomurabacteria bacterium]